MLWGVMIWLIFNERFDSVGNQVEKGAHGNESSDT